MKVLDNNWLPLIEYSLKSGVSTSTVRRRIKTKKIKYKLHEGKYYIFCDSDEIAEFETSTVSSKTLTETLQLTKKALESLLQAGAGATQSRDEVVEEQAKKIRLLEEEVQDLKTLVAILEGNT